MFRGVVQVDYQGRLGNRLFQYCLGRIIAEKLGYDLDCEPIVSLVRHNKPRSNFFHIPPRHVEILSGQIVDLERVFESPRRRKIVLRGFFQRYEYFRPYKAQIRERWLSQANYPSLPPGSLTIHIRTGDIWIRNTGGRLHFDYPALPFSYYRNIIEERPWSEIHLVAQHPEELMVQKLLREYDAVLHSDKRELDFSTLRASQSIVLSVSTFAWWGAWLSRAGCVYMPLCGSFSSATSPDKNFIVDDEKRYKYVDVPHVQVWEGTDEQERELLDL